MARWSLPIRRAMRAAVERAVRRENEACRAIALDQIWRANEMRDRSRKARIVHETAKEIAEAIERRHAKG